MIQSNELRIGNLVGIKDFMHKVNKISGLGIESAKIHIGLSLEFRYKDLEPIPITEKWHEALGGLKNDRIKGNFLYPIITDVKDEEGYIVDVYISFQYAAFFKEPAIFLEECNNIGDCECIDLSRKNEIKYVHQLQNLYFSLSGKELEIDLSKLK